MRSEDALEKLRVIGRANKGKKLPHNSEWNKKIGISQIGDKNHMWKGDSVSYKGLHDWVNKNFGKPDICERCNASGLSGMYINWANVSGSYKRDRNDWIRLCKSCHNKMDGIVNNFHK